MAELQNLNLSITGMHCASCAANIERDLSQVDGVSQCRVNLATGSALVSYEQSQLDESTIIKRISGLGYGAEVGSPDVLTVNTEGETEARKRFLVSLAFAAPLMVVAMWPMAARQPLLSSLGDGLIQALLAMIVVFFSGRSIIADALLQARHLRVNMNSLIAMGTLAAFGWSLYALWRVSRGVSEALYFESAGMIVTLILLGRFLEAKAKRSAGRAIEELVKLRPVKASAIINGVEVEIDAAAVQPGMTLLVRPGDKVPVDGEILEGEAVLDESLLTGESMPVEKKAGASVIGGSINGNTAFQMKATATGEDCFVAGVIRLVSEAQARKAPAQQLADRVATIFVPAVVGAAILTGLLWYLLAPDAEMLIRSVIAVLIIACPCALGLATPAAVLVGTGRGAREGIVIKGGDVLEALSKVDAVVFDKTGTLTRGKLEVVAVKTFGQVSEQNLIRMVGSVEVQSEHPVGRAVVRYMRERQISPVVVKNVETRPGFGLVGDCDNRRLMIGSRPLMEKEQSSFGPALSQGEQEMEAGRTVVFVALDGQVVGLLALADQVRGDARELVEKLNPRMKRIAMLSGDNRKTASGVARSLGIEHCEAEVKPEQKQLIVESYRRAGYNVAMVGDGINDAPALAAATVGVAIGTGTQVAIETADVVMVRPELDAVSRMFSLSTQTMRTIKQNLFWAFAYNVAAIPVAAGLFYPLFGLSLSPVLAAVAMSLSSVFVVTNSLRLNKVDL